MSRSLSLSSYARNLRHWIGQYPASCGLSEKDFNGLSVVLFGMQFEHNAAYAHFCRSRGTVPGKVSTWREIPALPAVAFKELEVTSVPADERTTVFFSSGTTGQQPSRHFHHDESLAVYRASAWVSFKAHLLPAASDFVAGTTLSLTPPPAAAPHSSLVRMMEVVRRNSQCERFDFAGRVGASGDWEIDSPQIVQSLNAAAKTERPLMLLGTAFSFVHLLDSIARQDKSWVLPRGSRVMETGGYRGRSRTVPRSELHRLITARFGIPNEQIICEYGMSELSSQAYDLAITSCSDVSRPGQPPGSCGSNMSQSHEGFVRIFRFPPWVKTCVISPENGQEVPLGATGLLRIVDLANVWSVQAVQTEDLAIRREDGFELLGRATQSESRGCSLLLADQP